MSLLLPQFPDTFPTAFPHHRPFTIYLWDKEWWDFHGYQVEVGKGRPLADTPKTWRPIGHIDGPASRYSTMQLYSVKYTKQGDTGFRWSQYRDGCFYALHGKIDILWHEEKFGHEISYEEFSLTHTLGSAKRKFPHRAVRLSNLLM